MKYHIIKEELGHSCRKCLNEKFQLGLKRKSCYYSTYPVVCRNCGKVKNIVKDIRFFKRMSITLKP